MRCDNFWYSRCIIIQLHYKLAHGHIFFRATFLNFTITHLEQPKAILAKKPLQKYLILMSDKKGFLVLVKFVRQGEYFA